MATSAGQAVARRRREREAVEAEERARLSGPGPNPTAPAYAQRTGGGLAGELREGVLQADTALRSAANTFFFGGANSLAAGLDALVPVSGQGIGERYAIRLAGERARDQYDAVHRPEAQQIGAGGAALLSLFAGKAPAAPRLIAGAAARSGRETAALLGAGGLSGLAFQNLSDAAAHHPTDWRDAAGAIAGGILGAAALPLGPQRAAAIGAAGTTITQDAVRGRTPSPAAVAQSATAGRLVGGIAGAAGRKGSENLSPRAKGKLGETMGAVRSEVNQMRREPGAKKLLKPVEGKAGTYPDGRSSGHFFEDKFGPRASLSAGQRIAQATLGPNYIVYHFLPEHVGKMVSLPLMGLAPHAASRRPATRPAAPRKAR